MKITDLEKLVYTGDPIAVAERPYRIVNNTMYIPGIDSDGEYADDLRIAVVDGAMTLFHKKPGETIWVYGGRYTDYQDMVSVIYIL